MSSITPTSVWARRFSAGASAEVINPTNPNYSQLSNPAAYALPTATSLWWCALQPSQGITGPPIGACYATSTAITTTVPSALGGQREIQFAVKFRF